MFRYNYHPLKNKERSTLIFLILFSALIRVPVILTLGDAGLEHEWKAIMENLTKHGVFSSINFDGFLIPNLFMPPLYAFYLYFFSLINLEEQSYVQLILSSQILLSSISVAVFYKINKIFFSEKISFFSSLIFSIFPLHVYACSQISSVSLQSFLTILFFYSIYKKKKFFINFFLFINRRFAYTFKRRVYCDFYFESFLSIIFFKNRNKKNFFSWFNNIYYNFALFNQKHLDI